MISRILVLALILPVLACAPAPAFDAVVVDALRWSAEPMVVAGAAGDLYVTAASGLSRYAHDPQAAPVDAGQSYIWTSKDGGDAWRYAGLDAAGIATPVRFRDAALGVEGDVDVAENGDVLSVDLAPDAAATLARSRDGGATWTTTSVVAKPFTDRPWVTAGRGSDAFLTINPGAVSKSTDGGQSFPVSRTLGGLPGRPSYDRARDLLYIPIANQIAVLRGSDLALLTRLAVPGLGYFDVVGVSMSAIRDDGTVYMAFSRAEDGGVHVYGAATADQGQTWAGVWRLSAPGSTGALPGVGAGAGKAGFAWYETPGEIDPSDVSASWAYRAALVDATGAPAPAVDVVPGPVHVGRVCLEGLSPLPDDPCNSAAGRKLLDFTGADVTPGGKLVLVFAQTTLPGAEGEPRIVFARENP
jgi:hypothetical protein